MPMPSLVKYFAFVGAALLSMMTLASFLLDPSTGATVVATKPKPAIVVQHDPRASKVERWRNEQAALKAAAQTQTATNASLVTKSEIAPPPQQVVAREPAPSPQPAQPAQTQAAQAEPALQSADVSAQHDAEAARAAEAAHAKAEKAKVAKAARKVKLARERARADQLARESGQQNPWQQGQTGFFGGSQQRTASGQQDAFYYNQRGSREQQAQAYAPRPTFGPFGGFGR